MAEYHQGQLDAKKKTEEHPPSNARGTRPTASASPPKPDADEVLAKMHGEVVKQLQALLDAEPVIPAIIAAEQSLPVRRNTSADLKPAAGVFH